MARFLSFDGSMQFVLYVSLIYVCVYIYIYELRLSKVYVILVFRL